MKAKREQLLEKALKLCIAQIEEYSPNEHVIDNKTGVSASLETLKRIAQ